MEGKVVITALYPHFRDVSTFVMVAKRGDVQYVMRTADMGHPVFVGETEGLTWSRHGHLGYGSYGQGIIADKIHEENLQLDPICGKVLAKGFEMNRLSFRVQRKSDRRTWPPFIHDQKRPLRRKFVETPKSYFITDPRFTYRMELPWVISVGLEDYGHMSIDVGVPYCYEDDHLEKLLKAIDTLPSPEVFADWRQKRYDKPLKVA